MAAPYNEKELENETIRTLLQLIKKINSCTSIREKIRLHEIFINLTQHVINRPRFAILRPIYIEKLHEHNWLIVHYRKYCKQIDERESLLDINKAIKVKLNAYL